MSINRETYKLSKVKNGIHYFAQITYQYEVFRNQQKCEFIELYNGKGFEAQGHIISVPERGFAPWKKGIRLGVEYAFTRLSNDNKIKIEVNEALGLIENTNPTIFAYISARSILDNFSNSETPEDKARLEKMLYSSWDFGLNGIPDLESGVIMRKDLV